MTVRASMGDRHGGTSDVRPSDASVGSERQHALWTVSDAGSRASDVSVDEGFALAHAGLCDRRWTASVGAATDASVGTRPHFAPLCIASIERQTPRATHGHSIVTFSIEGHVAR
jgi:hypothetical protein